MYADELEVAEGALRCSVLPAHTTGSHGVQVYSRMIVTCLTFALYSGHFTKSVNQGVAALKESDGDPDSAPMQKRCDCVIYPDDDFLLTLDVDGNSLRSLKQTSSISPRSTLIVCSFTPRARMWRFSHWSFDSTMYGRPHSKRWTVVSCGSR
jgi:hypothetical protein